MRPIAFYDPSRVHRRLTDQAARDAGATPDVTDPHHVGIFEDALQEYTGAAGVVGVGSGTDALVIALLAVGIGPGDEVIVPAFTFFASASAVALVGAVPVFVDIDLDTYALAYDSTRRAIGPRTRAILVVHLFDRLAHIAPIVELAREHDLLVVEDSAEGLGMRLDGRHCGTIGDVGVVSFFPTKTAGAFGDAGAVISSRPDVVEAARAIARPRGRWPSSLDSVQAFVVRRRLALLEEEIADRARISGEYTAALLHAETDVGTPSSRANPSNGYRVDYVYQLDVPERDDVRSRLAALGVETETYYPRVLPDQPCFGPSNSRTFATPNARRASGRALALPLYPWMRQPDVDFVAEAVFAVLAVTSRVSRPRRATLTVEREDESRPVALCRPDAVDSALREAVGSPPLILGSATRELEGVVAKGCGYPESVVLASRSHAMRLIAACNRPGPEGIVCIVDLGSDSAVAGIGEAVAVCTSSTALCTDLRELRNHGQRLGERFTHYRVGENARVDEVAAHYLLGLNRGDLERRLAVAVTEAAPAVTAEGP